MPIWHPLFQTMAIPGIPGFKAMAFQYESHAYQVSLPEKPHLLKLKKKIQNKNNQTHA